MEPSLKIVDTANTTESDLDKLIVEPMEITDAMREIGFCTYNKYITEINAQIKLRSMNNFNYVSYSTTVAKQEEPFLNAALGKFKEAGYFVSPSEPSLTPDGKAKLFNITIIW